MRRIDRVVEENAWLKSQLAEVVTEKRDLRKENHRLLAEIDRLQEALAADAWTRWGNAVGHVRRTEGPEGDGSVAGSDPSWPSYRVLPQR